MKPTIAASSNRPVPISLADIEHLADAVLPLEVRDFIAGGSGSEMTLAANRSALDSVHIVPRVLRDVSMCNTATDLVGSAASMPVAVAPIAYHRLVHPDGELAAARAAKDAGIPITVSTLSSYPMEEIAAVGATTWFQLYWLRDRALCFELVRRAEDAGCSALMLTVDMPWMGRRLRDIRNSFELPLDVTAANLGVDASSQAHRPASGGSAIAAHTSLALAPSLTWSDVDDLRAITRLPLIIKGILAPEDAAQAAQAGVDAVVVSNHGGRQLDGAVASIDMLPAVKQAVDGRCQVLFDSGIRSGTDVLRALASGADGILLGRPVMWGLALDGESGAGQVLSLLATEFRNALGLAGCDSVTAARKLRTLRYPALLPEFPNRPRT